MDAFQEHIYLPEDESFIASSVEVYTRSNGYFVVVETDAYEGSASITLPAARLLLEVLKRAIDHADKERLETPSKAT